MRTDKIPKAREMIELLIREIDTIDRDDIKRTLTDCLPLMRREKPFQMTPQRNRSMTPEIAAEIKAYKADHPNVSFQKIANLFRVNSARVSEVLNNISTFQKKGKRSEI